MAAALSSAANRKTLFDDDGAAPKKTPTYPQKSKPNPSSSSAQSGQKNSYSKPSLSSSGGGSEGGEGGGKGVHGSKGETRDAKQMHPSWAAKQQAKDVLQQRLAAAANTKPTRIKFDD